MRLFYSNLDGGLRHHRLTSACSQQTTMVTCCLERAAYKAITRDDRDNIPRFCYHA